MRIAAHACFEICSSKYALYIFGIPLPPSISGMRASTTMWTGAASMAIARRRTRRDSLGKLKYLVGEPAKKGDGEENIHT